MRDPESTTSHATPRVLEIAESAKHLTNLERDALARELLAPFCNRLLEPEAMEELEFLIGDLVAVQQERDR